MKPKIFLKKLFSYSFEYVSIIIYRIRYRLIKNRIQVKDIKSIEETIEKIYKEHVSVSRYGDGEFKWLLKEKQRSFETNSEELSNRLIEVLGSHEANHIVCISPAMGGLEYNCRKARVYWERTLGKCGLKLMRYIDADRTYYNANITRFYLNNINRDMAAQRFRMLFRLWENRRVLIVEGEFTRFGVGNDLLNRCAEVKRIIAPSQKAFESYEIIVNCIKKHYMDDTLVLLSLGPTATVMAYDLARLGMQAIDIGHIDVEYEWFLRGADEKIAIPGKAVNEAVGDRSDEPLDGLAWKRYCDEIIDWAAVGKWSGNEK